MKKSLSFLVALALVFGLFASMASAADANLTTAQKYQQFVDSGILKGNPDGNPRLGDKLTRAEFVTIADAIAGLNTTSVTGQTFSDVTPSQWWYGAIEAAASAGLVDGVGAGKFGPKLNVTVEQAIKVFVTLAGLKPVDGASVEGSSDWAGPYIQAAIDAGLAVPSNYKDDATRGQSIDIAFGAYQATQSPTLSDVKAVANADDTITVTGKAGNKADKVTVALGDAAAVAATLKNDGTFTYTTAAQTAGEYTLKVVAYQGDKAAANQSVKVTIDGFSVASATVLNAKQIAIQFNKAAQNGGTGSATSASYYSLSAVSSTYSAPDAVSLSDDKMTATLTFKNGFPLNNYGQLYVHDLKSASGKTITTYKQPIYLSDTTAPTVSGVSYSGGLAKVTFSEPLSAVGTVSINGAQIYTSGSTYYTPSYLDVTDGSFNGKDITGITIYGLESGSSYTLNIVGGYDTASEYDHSKSGTVTTAPNYFDYSTTLNIAADTTPPTVTNVTVSGGVITVQYSEALDSAKASLGTISSAGYPGIKSSDITQHSDDATKVDYDVSSWLGGNNFLTLNITISGYQDTNYPTHNVGAGYTTAVTISKDTTAPVASSVFYTTQGGKNVVVIDFDENIDATQSVAATAASVSYDFTDPNGVVTKGTPVNNIQYGFKADNTDSADNSQVYFVPANGALAAGTYSFYVANFADSSKNKSDSTTLTLTVTGSSASGIVKLATTQAGGGITASPSQLKFVFTDNSNGTLDSGFKLSSSALDPSKYLINGVALPSDTHLYFLNNQYTVVAELPASSITATGDRIISVQGITDVNGNTLDTSSTDNTQHLVTLTENVKPVPGAITVSSDKQITVSFSENVSLPTTATAVTGVELYLNGSASKEDVTFDGLTFSVSGNTLTIRSSKSLFSPTTPIIVKFVSTNIQDGAGNSVADTQVSK